MIHRIVASKHISLMLICLLLLVCYCTGLIAQDHDAINAPAASSTLHVTHILGFEGVSNNANGDLSIQDRALRFKPHEGSPVQVPIGAIQDLFLGEQDKQVGGKPMMLAKTAAPYGGGRVVSLFAHKKYDIVTLEYLDSNGGFHGAIFQLNQGQGPVLRSELEAERTPGNRVADEATKRNTEETSK